MYKDTKGEAMQVSGMSKQYVFQSPYSNQVQIGRLDTTSSSEQSTTNTTEQSQANTTNESKTFADSKAFQETLTKEVPKIENSDNLLNIYA
jgi:hypothetical protein